VSGTRSHDTRRSRLIGIGLAVGVYAAALVIGDSVGFRMQIPWRFFQLLDGPMLRAHPLESLCLLHCQPPGLNALLALVLRVAESFAVSPELVAGVCFAALGLLGTLALAYLTGRLTGSWLLAPLAVVVLLADPGVHIFGHMAFYEFLDQVLGLLLLAATMRYFRYGRRSGIVAVAGLAAALALTRSLFHPLWVVGYCALVIALRGRLEPARSDRLAHGTLAVAVLVPTLLAWPTKNEFVFERFTMGSTTAWNAARGVPGCNDVATPTSERTAIPPAARDLAARAIARCGAGAGPVVMSETKHDGSPNWNHIGFLVAVPALDRCATDWRLHHPMLWLEKAAGQYAMWTRPTFVNPYTGLAYLFPTDARWHAYMSTYERIMFVDLRPAVERLLPDLFLHREAVVDGKPVPYTVFGFVVLPTILALAGWQQVARPRSVRTAVAAAALAMLVLPMMVTCLTDGQEGNRIRLSTTPALLVVEICLVGELLARDEGP
jgi:hypothetical protein